MTLEYTYLCFHKIFHEASKLIVLFSEIMEEAVEDQIILGVRVRPETMRVDQENDMSSRWSCEKFAEASLMRLLSHCLVVYF